MKRFLFGVLLTVIGFTTFLVCLLHALKNPWDYNGITGLPGALLGTGLLWPFILSLAVFAVGLVISWYEAYRRK